MWGVKAWQQNPRPAGAPPLTQHCWDVGAVPRPLALPPRWVGGSPWNASREFSWSTRMKPSRRVEPCCPRLWKSPSSRRSGEQSRGVGRSCGELMVVHEVMSLWDSAGALLEGSGTHGWGWARQWLAGSDPSLPEEGKSNSLTLAGLQSIPVQSGEQLRAQLLILSM